MTPAKKESSPAKKISRTWLWLIILFLMIGIIMLISYGIYNQLKKSNLTTRSLAKTITAMDTAINTTQAELNKLRLKQESNFEFTQKKQTQIQTRLKKIQEFIPVADPETSASFAALATLDQLFETIHPLSANTETTNINLANNTSIAQKFWHGIKQTWGQLVTVRHANEGQLLSPTATKLIILRLHSEISVAQWALLHQSPSIYQTALANIHRELIQYFPKNEIKKILEHLASLPQPPFQNEVVNDES